MRRCGAGLIAAVLVLAGCKSTDPKPTDKDAAGTTASRTKGSEGKLPEWLQPFDRQSPLADPADPKTAGQDVVGGRVMDPFNRAVAGAYIQVELVNPPSGTPASIGITTDKDGVFYTRGLKPGKTYNLTADATIDGKQYGASVQTMIPKLNLTLSLRDDLATPNVRGSTGSGTFPPQPSPFDPNYDRNPQLPPPSMPRPSDGAWTPGVDPTRSMPATTSPSTPQPSSTGTIPPPNLTPPSTKPVSRPENVAGQPTWTAPPANIPGPVSPPNYTNPPPPPSPPNPMMMGTPGNGRGFILLDTLGRVWEFPGNKSGAVVLVEFMTTVCPNSKGAIPSLVDFQARYASAGLEVIAVACDEPTAEKPRMDQQQRALAASKYARDNNLNYQVFVEPGEVCGVVRDRFDITQYPTAVLLDGTGVVVWKGHPNKRAELEAAIKKALGK